ncbi:MAG TPA: hemerythrin domain-containing protein [Flavisolibacter sp.]|nr:hemerythrin domain-containing protein [Flavisolibacter sp.]
MQRYNIFFPVHKGLRALLFETAIQLQQTSFLDAVETAQAIDQVKTVIALFESHAHKEDSFVFPAIAAWEPSVVAAFEAEHDEDHALGESLQNWLTAMTYAAAPSAKQTIGEKLTAAYLRFMVFNLCHMAKEEEAINPILWRYYSDSELHDITLKIMKAVPQPEMADFSRWMVRGLNTTEILHWLRGVKNTAPKPAFYALLNVAERELQPHRWNLVQDSLTEGAMVV